MAVTRWLNALKYLEVIDFLCLLRRVPFGDESFLWISSGNSIPCERDHRHEGNRKVSQNFLLHFREVMNNIDTSLRYVVGVSVDLEMGCSLEGVS